MRSAGTPNGIGLGAPKRAPRQHHRRTKSRCPYEPKAECIMNSSTIRKLLSVIVSFDRPPTAEQFARAAYAESKAWKRSRKIVGGAAGVLGRLRVMGLVEQTGDGCYYVTARGREFLAQGTDPKTLRKPDPPKNEPPQRYAPGWVPWASAPGGFVWCDGIDLWWPNGFGGWIRWMPVAPPNSSHKHDTTKHSRTYR